MEDMLTKLKEAADLKVSITKQEVVVWQKISEALNFMLTDATAKKSQKIRLPEEKLPSQYSLPKTAYTVNEFLETFPISRTKLYATIKAGKLKATKLGKRTLFFAADIAEFLSALPRT